MRVCPRRAPLPFLCAVLATAAFLAPPAPAGGTGSHPHFDDQGALVWHTTLADALGAAKAQRRVVVVEYGRKHCTHCRILCAQVMPLPAVKSRLSASAVGLASDCDDPEPTVDAMLRRNLPGADMLPLVGILDPDGRWITGFSGACSAERFQAHLASAERALATWRALHRPAEPTAAPACAAPVGASACARAREAAEKGAWSEVVRLCRQAGEGPESAALRARVRTWAEARLDAAIEACRGSRFEDAMAAVSAVRQQLRGEPEAEEASRGTVAIRLAQAIARIDPADAAREKARESAYLGMRGTRWERIFERA
jgi:hypothetical protein